MNNKVKPVIIESKTLKSCNDVMQNVRLNWRQHEPLTASPLDNPSLVSSFYEAQEEPIPLKCGIAWLEVEILDWSQQDDAIEIEVGLENDLGGKVAILIPASDHYSTEDFNVARTLDYSLDTTQHDVFFEAKTWELGNKSRIVVYRNPNIPEDLEFKLLLLLRPNFPVRNARKCKVKFDVKSLNNRQSLIDNESKKYISDLRIQCGSALPKDDVKRMQLTHNILHYYGAYNFQGSGNSLHPKQNLTIRGLKHIIDEMIEPTEQISISYIGTDTTENFCSVIRWLDKSGYIDKISKINVWYTDDWDSEFIDWLPNNHPLKNHPKVKYKSISAYSISEGETSKVVITTYVSPWVGLNDDTYKQLLRTLMSRESFLLSVDPKTATNSVRVAFKNEINHQVLYKEILQFLPAKVVTNENPSVEWTVWRGRSSQNSEAEVN